MRVFVTGATGFIGTAVVEDLLRAGHQVLGLARSDAGAEALIAAGAEVQRGDLEDLESLRSGAAQSDGVIHTAFNHDFSKFQANCEMDRIAIETLGDTLAGSGRPLVVTSGLLLLASGRAATEEDVPPPVSAAYPRSSEATGAAQVAKGVPVAVVRLPQVHDRRKMGLVSYAIAIAKAKGVSAYVGDGKNRWSAAHLLDVAPVYRLALERAAANGDAKGTGIARYHAVAEEGVSVGDIAEAIGRGLKIPVKSISPEEAGEHFGFLGFFVGFDGLASSALTQQWLGWRPTQVGLLTDLEHARDFEA